MSASEQVFAIVDVGTAFIKVLIVELNPALKILGWNYEETKGMVHGKITNVQDLKECVHRAIGKAESKCGFNVRSAVVSVSGYNQIKGKKVQGDTSVKDCSVSLEDMQAAKADAYRHSAQKKFTIVQRIDQGYSRRKDNGEISFSKNPEGLPAKSLQFYLWMIEGDIDYLTMLVQIFNQYDLRVTELFAASWASAAATDDGEKESRIVIDIGEGTTDFAIFDHEGTLLKAGIIPVGGSNIRRDVTSVFQTEDRARDLVKEANAVFKDGDASEEDVEVEQEFYNRYVLNYVVHVRVKEIFELVLNEVPKDFKIEKVVLTGGTANLKNISAVAGSVFKADSKTFVCASKVKIELPEEINGDPRFSTVVGLAVLFKEHYDLRHAAVAKKKFWKQLWSQIKEIFD